MKQATHATIIGDKTAVVEVFRFQANTERLDGAFSAAPMFDADMNHTEWGIAPDVKDSITPEDYTNKIDPIIEKAIEILKK
jgi:hypothetical protein